MKVSDFDYELPPERVAQTALEPRDAARLLVHDLARDATEHRHVRDLSQILTCGDLVVVNDTRVRHARLRANRASGGAVEVLLLERLDPRTWRAMLRPGARIKPLERLSVEAGELVVQALDREDGGATWRVSVSDARGGVDGIEDALERVGAPPLPPYIRRDEADADQLERDRERYQTIFARERGAVAAPTAGLHFTQRLVDELSALGVEFARVTLHVGAGTFKPVTVEDAREHVMHAERFELSQAAVDSWRLCRARGGRVLAVGTTVVRVLESCIDERGELTAQRGETRLFLTPGARFRAIDALLTNFHLPRSTLLMLVSAFAGRERVLRLYREAVEMNYRFYSYGDAMLLQGRARD